MKILSIKLRNINSLKGDWEVDFATAPLKDAGLFAIVGPTGSGKSTLLDCITLALFNKVPRLGNISKDSIATGGWIMTRHEKECYAEVKYSCKSGFYTSKWSIAKTKKGESFQDYAMQVYDENGVPLTDKRGEVPVKNATLIGLTYEQFIKAILLSQGEFAKFLQSDAKEKAKLLEEITGQKDYRRLGKRAFEYHKELKVEVDNQELIAASIKSDLLTEEAYQFLVNEIKQLEEELQKLSETKVKISKQIATKKQIEEYQKTVDDRKGKIEKNQKEIENFNGQYAIRLKNYENLLPHKEHINEFIRLTTEDSTQSNKIKELENTIESKGLQIDKNLKTIEGLLKFPVSIDDYLDKLESFKTNVLGKLQQQKQFQQNENLGVNKTKTLLNKGLFVEEKKLFNQLGNNLHLLQQLKIRLSNTQNQIEAFCKKNNLQPENLGERLVYLRQQQNDYTRLEELVKDFVRITQNIQRLAVDENKAVEKIAVLHQQIQDFELQESDLTSKFNVAEKEREHILSVKKLEEYRNELVEGEACPLCGSEVHPYIKAYLKDVSVIETVYQQVKTNLEQVKLEKVKCGKEFESTKKELDRCKKELEVSGQEKQQKIVDINLYKEKYNILEIKSINAVQELKHECASFLVGTEACNEWILEVPQLEQLLEEIEQFDENATNLHELNEEISQLYSGNDIEVETKQLRESMTSVVNALQEANVLLQSTKGSNQITQKQLQNITTTTLKSLLELGFDSIVSAKNALIDEVSYKKLGDQRSSLTSQLQTEYRLLEQNLDQLAKEMQLDDAIKTFGALVDESEEIELSIRSTNDNLSIKKSNKYRHENQSAAFFQKELLIKLLKEKKYPFELLSRQIGDATGDKFNNYAQKLSLRHLLTYTNLRLQKINNRYHLKLNENQSDTDLEVEDSFMAYERRSVKTLSGGETFMVSLALALGLSDLASKDIRIESLFIDEGFGTLDGDTLEDAISTLEQLQSESNKLVGIISHVDSLKERITTQLILDRQNNGYSTLTVSNK
jgi:exonuclease SbcC